MEGEGGEIRRRLSLLEQMSAIDAVISAEKRPAAVLAAMPAQINRTLLDIIRDEEPRGGSLLGHKDRKSWKAFRDRLRLKRAGAAAWTSSIPVQNNNPAPNNNLSSNGYSNSGSFMSHINSADPTHSPRASVQDNSAVPLPHPSPQMTRRTPTRFGSLVSISVESEPDSASAPPDRSLPQQFSGRNSTRYGIGQTGGEDGDAGPAREGTLRLSVALAEERALSAREAVEAQEAGAVAEAAEENGQAVRMSLMELLEETDRQMGFVGPRGEGEAVYEEEKGGGCGGVEHSCCVCMVRSKGAAFIPCGHTFCRLCSRELWVQRGNCPLCNGFILEILDIF